MSGDNNGGDDDQSTKDDDQIENNDAYHLTEDELRKIIDERNRLTRPSFPDEPLRHKYLPYQRILDEVYKLQADNQPIPMSLYQIARTEYLIGMYCAMQKLIGDAADHYARGAKAAERIPDWALYAQLKHLESSACTRADHNRQYYRAFEAARDAWEAWRKLPSRDLTDDIHFAFKLADAVGVTAVRVAEYDVAVDSMQWAAILLLRLQERPDMDSNQYANDDLFLTWDWATVYVGVGNYRRAFKSILQTRRKGKDLLEDINRVRLQWLIAFIALNCAEEGPAEGYTRGRLLVVAGKAIDAAYRTLKECDDKPGEMLTLLADAKLLGLLRITDKRVDKIEQAETIATTLNDPAALGQVHIAWGDEYVFQGDKRRARVLYRKVEMEMTQVGFLELARVAQQRLARLAKKPVRAPRKPTDPRPGTDISQN